MAEIVLDQLTRRYPGGAVAVDRVDLEVRDGEFLVLVGPSGCGKSTTLRMIAGLEEITEGEVRIGGEVMNGVPSRARDLAMVFQDYALYPYLTVRENLAFPLTLVRLGGAAIREKVDAVAETLGLDGLLDRRPAGLSGGQRQRVAMGRAMVREPRAFLMDEPLSNLDARLRVEMRTQLRRLQRRLATTTLYVTHDQTEAMTLGDRVVVMRAGRVQQVGTPRELYIAPANLFVATFIGSPSMNLLRATVDGDLIRTPLGEIPLTDANRRALRAHGHGRQLVAGVRAESLREARSAAEQRPDRSKIHFRARVEVLEWLGAEVHAYLDAARTDGTPLVARLEPESTVEEGDVIEVYFEPRNVHLFDAETGRTLAR